MSRDEVFCVKRDTIIVFFNNSNLAELLDDVLDNNEREIHAKILQVVAAIHSKVDCGPILDSVDVYADFRENLCVDLTKKALNMELSSPNSNIAENIVYLISDEYVKEAIYGKPMKDAFNNVLNRTLDVCFSKECSILANASILVDKIFSK